MAALNRNYGTGAIEFATPLSELCAAEAGVCIDEETLAKLLQEMGLAADATLDGVRTVQEVKTDAVRAMLAFIFSKGPDPRIAIRRLYAVAQEIGPQFIKDMPQEVVALLLGDDAGRATVSARSNAIFHGLKSVRGFKTEIGGNHKTAGAREKMRQAQLGNQNRKGGKPKLSVIEGGAGKQSQAA